MMPVLHTRLIVLNLLLVAALVAMALLGQYQWQAPPPLKAELLAGNEPAPASAARAYDRAAVLARPLFLQGRRPLPPAEAPAAEEKRDELTAYRLVGIVGQGESATVILRSGERTVRLEKDKKIGGWQFQRGTESGAEFVDAAGAKRTLPLIIPTNSSAIKTKPTRSARSR